MAIFKKRFPVERSQKLLTELRSRAAALSDKRTAAETTLAEAMAARQRHMLEGDLADERTAEKLQAAVDSCSSKLAGLNSALDALQAQIAETEQRIAVEHNAIQRAAAADKLAQQVATIEEALPKFMSASGALTDALSALGHWHFESSQMSSFTLNATAQIELASGFSLAELRATVDRIRNGDAPIPREPDNDSVAVVEPPPSTMTVWLLRSVKFRDHTGVVRHARQYDDVELPLETAQRALRLSVAAPLTDSRRRSLKGARGGDPVDPRALDIVDLDAVDEAKVPGIGTENNPVLAAATFRVIDRSSEARTLKIDGPRV
jgi:hypothetical protein